MASAATSTDLERRDLETSLAIARLKRLALQVGQVKPLAEKSGAPEAQKSFVRGVLAHLLIVPAWVVPPAVLFASLLSTFASFGLKALPAILGFGVALVNGPKKARPFFCAMLLSIAGATYQAKAVFNAGLASFLCWLATRSRRIEPSPAFFEFISRWAKDYYAQTALRGCLNDIKPTQTFFGFHPHGCLSAGFTINGCYNPDFMKAAGRMTWLCDGNLRHKNPGFRIMAEAYRSDMRAIESCDPQDFKLQMAQGVNVAFIPGGFLDATAFEHGKDITVLQSRKGFIKYCLQYGYRAHPVYTFGECETYHTFRGLKSLRMQLAKRNVPALAFFGWEMLPLLPKPSSKILTYVGPGIDLPQISEPTDEEINHWHQVYTQALHQVFEDNKAEAGYPLAKLTIL